MMLRLICRKLCDHTKGRGEIWPLSLNGFHSGQIHQMFIHEHGVPLTFCHDNEMGAKNFYLSIAGHILTKRGRSSRIQPSTYLSSNVLLLLWSHLPWTSSFQNASWVTCIQVAVADANSNDVKAVLKSLSDIPACLAIGRILADRTREDDLYTASYTPRERDKFEGKLSPSLTMALTLKFILIDTSFSVPCRILGDKFVSSVFI